MYRKVSDAGVVCLKVLSEVIGVAAGLFYVSTMPAWEDDYRSSLFALTHDREVGSQRLRKRP